MKISIICITANPTEKQYAWKEALASYVDLADEVIIVDGGSEKLEVPEKVKVIHIPDPEVWNWAEHAKRLNIGLLEATGDWIIKVDIDWIFNQAEFGMIRQKLAELHMPVASFQKKTFYPFLRFIEKGEVPIAINKEFKDKIRFGKDRRHYTDLTYPIYWEGGMEESGVPVGNLVEKKDWGRTAQTIWNFDYTFKTQDMAAKMFLRGSKAHEVYFGETQWGTTEEDSFGVFINAMRSKVKRALPIGNLNMLPKYIRSRIENLKPEEFGYNGWGLL